MSLGWSATSPTLRSVRRSNVLSGPTLVNTSNVVLKSAVMPEWRKLFEAGDSDFGGGAWVPLKCGLPMRSVLQTPRIWEQETTQRTNRSGQREGPVNAFVGSLVNVPG